MLFSRLFCLRPDLGFTEQIGHYGIAVTKKWRQTIPKPFLMVPGASVNRHPRSLMIGSTTDTETASLPQPLEFAHNEGALRPRARRRNVEVITPGFGLKAARTIGGNAARNVVGIDLNCPRASTSVLPLCHWPSTIIPDAIIPPFPLVGNCPCRRYPNTGARTFRCLEKPGYR
jgi:hypothetical protein